MNRSTTVPTPRAGAGIAHLIAAALLLGATLASAAPPRALPAKSILASVGRVEDPRLLIVKLKDGEEIDLRSGRFAATGASAKSRATAERLDAVLRKSEEIRVERAITVPKPLLDALRQRGELATGEALADLSQFYMVRVPSGSGIGLLGGLLALDEVENAYAYRAKRHPEDRKPNTPDFLNQGPGQGYRGPAPLGIDIDAAWNRGLRGEGVTVVDVETNWNLAHEDLDHLVNQDPPVPIIPPGDWRDPAVAPNLQENFDHGTATLGVLAAGDNEYGTSGLVPSATIRVVPINRLSDPWWIAPNAVVAATLAMRPGDVMLLEVEHPDGSPFETDDLEFAVVRQATALGIHVVEPAGNVTGGRSLDIWGRVLDPSGRSKFDWRVRDSGAIMVAGGESAVANNGHRRYPNSNCGSRVDAYAWGQHITTLGYGARQSALFTCPYTGDPFQVGTPDPNQLYTYCYNGTSGAGAIVAGAVAVLEQRHREKWGRPASVREMRNHLRLGTPGSSFMTTPPLGNWFCDIGHQPDLAYHLDLFDQGGIVAHSFQVERAVGPLGMFLTFGRAIASPGDVDRDGLADVAIGNPTFSSPNPPGGPNVAGRVYLFSARSGKLLWTVDGPAFDAQLGSALTAIGDVDGDGVGDLAAGAPSSSGNLGIVLVLSGRTGATIDRLLGQAAGGLFGAALASLDDVDGDGVRDIVVGGPGEPGLPGQIELWSGRTRTRIWSQTATQTGSEFGFAVAGTDDLDGDGIADVIVGAPRYFDAATGTRPGAVTLHSGATGAQLFFLPGELPSGYAPSGFGSAVAGAGDLTGDGVADFVVGAPRWGPTGGSGLGKVYVYRSTGRLLKAYTGAQAGEALGSSVAGGFDWNGDGLLDVAAGQPGKQGQVFVYQGPFLPGTPGPTTKVFPTQDPNTGLGSSIAILGDTNGDGLPDLGAGEPGYQSEGRAFVFAGGPAEPEPEPAPLRLIADVPAIEAFDTNNDGNGGGGTSPSQVRFHLDAGTARGGDAYWLIGTPRPPFTGHPTAEALVASGSPYLIAAEGKLEEDGTISTPRFGPIPKGLLCPGVVGAEFDFKIVVLSDVDGNGSTEKEESNVVTVKIIHEFPGC